MNQIAELDYSLPFISTSSNDDTNNKSMDITPDKGDEMARSSSTLSIGRISSKAEREDKIEEKKGSAQIALNDSGTLPNILTKKNIYSSNMVLNK